MSDGMYFVRSKGRISGPFDLSGLQRLARRQLISRFDEVSDDKVVWSAAGEFEDVFPSAATPRTSGAEQPAGPAAVAAVAVVASPPPGPRVAGAGADGDDEPRFYYSQGGSTVGPLPLNILRALADNGTLRAQDVVWSEHASVGAPAYQIPQLAQVYSRGRSAGTARASAGAADRVAQVDTGLAQRTVARSQRSAAVTGHVVAGLLLMLMNAPLARYSDRLSWWWEALRQTNGAFVGVICIFGLTGALTLFVIVPLVQGLARAIPVICLAAAGLCIWTVGAVAWGGPMSAGLISAAVMLIIVLSACLLTVCRFRLVGGGSATAGRTAQGVFAATLVIVSVVGLIGVLGELGDGLRWAPGWVVAVVILLILASLIGTAAGVLGVTASVMSLSRPVIMAAAVCSGVALVLLTAANLTTLVGVASLTGTLASVASSVAPDGTATTVATGWVLMLLVRMVACFYCYVTLLTSGLSESLVALHLRPLAGGR